MLTVWWDEGRLFYFLKLSWRVSIKIFCLIMKKKKNRNLIKDATSYDGVRSVEAALAIVIWLLKIVV